MSAVTACPRALAGASCSSSGLSNGRVAHPATRPVQCSLGGGSSSNSSSEGSKRGKGMGRGRARTPGVYEVKVITPPPRSLGIYALPPNTHNGEEIEIDGQGYVVTTVVLKYKLQAGKYVRDHNRLEVQPTGRYFVNMMLDSLIKGRYIGPTGAQD